MIDNKFKNKILLITGGTGSFGNATLNYFSNYDFKEIRIFSRDEKKQDDLRKKLKDDRVKFYLGDVRDISSTESVVDGVNYIFHAAALKQVPSCEFFPMQAVKTNIIGTENLLKASMKYKVEKTVVLSTDKAVYPVNAMGMTKALMEKVMISQALTLSESNQTICGTRYGNVMASRGSVIPLFIKQIKSAITVTDPKMTRFMMSLDDATDLVLYAFENGVNGDIFVQKAPSCEVGTLIIALQKIFSVKNEIKVIGTRHGEKLHETLVNRGDMAKAEDLGKYFRIPADNRNLNYNSFFTDGEEEINNATDYSSNNVGLLNVDQTVELLSNLDIVKLELS